MVYLRGVLDNRSCLRKYRRMLDPVEERITRKIFEPLAGRKFTDKEVEAMINDVEVIGETIRNMEWLRKALGLDKRDSSHASGRDGRKNR